VHPAYVSRVENEAECPKHDQCDQPLSRYVTNSRTRPLRFPCIRARKRPPTDTATRPPQPPKYRAKTTRT